MELGATSKGSPELFRQAFMSLGSRLAAMYDDLGEPQIEAGEQGTILCLLPCRRGEVEAAVIEIRARPAGENTILQVELDLTCPSAQAWWQSFKAALQDEAKKTVF